MLAAMRGQSGKATGPSNSARQSTWVGLQQVLGVPRSGPSPVVMWRFGFSDA